MEHWKPILDFPYEVSCKGRVRRSERGFATQVGRVLHPGLEKGYERVKLSKNGIASRCFVHTLVATAFVGPRPSAAHEINHIDFNRANNAASNLEWVTKAENRAFSVNANRQASGASVHLAKLTPEQVLEIRAACEARGRGKYAQLAREYGVRLSTIERIDRRRTWKHL